MRHDPTVPTTLGRMHVSAETACEVWHKALPRERRDRGDQDCDELGQCPVRGILWTIQVELQVRVLSQVTADAHTLARLLWLT
jgi:hypothetical protein